MVAANASRPRKQTIKVFRCYGGGGYQLEIDGTFVGVFPSAREAREFARTWGAS